MYRIVITSEIVGHSYLYQKLNQSGRRKKVPAYEMTVTLQGERYKFSVTRDVTDTVFNKKPRHFDTGGECPPSRTTSPYYGSLYKSRSISFAIRLSDKDCSTGTLFGVGDIRRRDVLIHKGPARSEGCFTVVGGKRAYKKFQKLLEPILKNGYELEVVVEPRTV